MQAILAVTVPFFAFVLCGYLAAHGRVLPQSAIPGLNAFVLFFALPCLLFRFGASTPFAQLIDPATIGLYAACALAMVAFTVAMTLRRAPGGLSRWRKCTPTAAPTTPRRAACRWRPFCGARCAARS